MEEERKETDFFEEYELQKSGNESDDTAVRTNPFLSAALSDKYYIPFVRTVIGVILAVVSLIDAVPDMLAMALGIAAVFVCGYNVFMRAFNELSNGKYLSESFLIGLAAVGAMAVSAAFEAVLLVLCADIVHLVRDKILMFVEKGITAKTEEEASDGLREVMLGALADAKPANNVLDLITKLFAPALLLVAVVASFLPPLVSEVSVFDSVHRALVFLVIAYPCVSVVIIPIVCKYGLVFLSENGFYFGNIGALKKLRKVTSLFFDKCGTVTNCEHMVTCVAPNKISADSLMFLAAYAEAFSDHPLADAIRRHSCVSVDKSKIIRHREEPGIGCMVQLNSSEIISIGSYELMQRMEVSGYYEPVPVTACYVAVGKHYAGRIEFDADVKVSAALAVSELRKQGVVNVALITGDNSLSATRIAKQLDITEVYADCEPKDKSERLRYIAEALEKDDSLAYVFAGRKPMPEISGADLTVAMGMPVGEMNADIIVDSEDPEILPEMLTAGKRVWMTAVIYLAATVGVKALIVAASMLFGLPLYVAYLIDSLLIIAEMVFIRRFLN